MTGISTTEAISKGKPVIPVITHKGKDTYAPQMSGNAEFFSKMQKGVPEAQINTKGSINKTLNKVLDNLDSYKSKAESASKKIKSNAAKQIAEAPAATKIRKFKMPTPAKASLYSVATLLTGAGISLLAREKD